MVSQEQKIKSGATKLTGFSGENHQTQDANRGGKKNYIREDYRYIHSYYSACCSSSCAKLVIDGESMEIYEKEKSSHGPWTKLEGDDDDEGPPWIKQRPWGTRGGGCAGTGERGEGSWGGPGFAMQVCGDFGREGGKCYLDGPESSLEC